MKENSVHKNTKRSFWAITAFYLLIAFEFAYMAGPFAAYFYAAYGPALNFFNEIPLFSQLIRFFLPHVVAQTKSTLIDAHNIIGIILATSGFIVFCIGAFRIYYNKLTKKGIATAGLYKYIRHPQYAAFIVCSFGLLLVWPRYIVALMFVTMLFAYYLLARVEEEECIDKFGESYIHYMKQTNMFFPFLLFNIKFPHIYSRFKTKKQRICVGFAIYILALSITLISAAGLNSYALNSLYAYYIEKSATVSLVEMNLEEIQKILQIAIEDEQVETRLAQLSENSMLLNYVMPLQWFVSEVPMSDIPSLSVNSGAAEQNSFHNTPKDYEPNLYKIIFTQVAGNNNITDGRDILKTVTERIPLMEVRINLKENKVIQVLEMPQEIKYQGIPVAIY